MTSMEILNNILTSLQSILSTDARTDIVFFRNFLDHVYRIYFCLLAHTQAESANDALCYSFQSILLLSG